MQKQTSTIPIVFVNASDPIGSGFVASLARPGGNLTGLLLYESSIVGKWLGMLKEIAPQTARVAFVANPKVEIYAYFLKEAQRTARTVAEDRGGASKPGPVFGRYRARYRRVRAVPMAASSFLQILLQIRTATSSFRLRPNTACRQFMGSAFPGKGWPYVLRRRWSRCSHSGFFLCRSHPARRKTSRPSGASSNQIRDHRKSQNRQGAWPHRAADPARDCRRGDRVRRRETMTIGGCGCSVAVGSTCATASLYRRLMSPYCLTDKEGIALSARVRREPRRSGWDDGRNSDGYSAAAMIRSGARPVYRRSARNIALPNATDAAIR